MKRLPRPFAVLTLTVAACQTPVAPGAAAAGFRAAAAPSVQDITEPPTKQRRGYLAVGGGLSFQSVETDATASTDRTTVQGTFGLGFYPVPWLDIGLADDVFWSKQKTELAGSTTDSTTTANNLGVFTNFVLYARPDLAFYAGPNVGVYGSSTEANGTQMTSNELSYGLQVGLRHWLSRAAAFKIEWRNIWSEQRFDTSPTAEPNDVFQSSLVVGVDLTF